MASNTKKLINFPQDLLDRINEYRWQNRIESEAEAIRRLVEIGLKNEEKKPTRRELK